MTRRAICCELFEFVQPFLGKLPLFTTRIKHAQFAAPPPQTQ
jgi:hypothetical protein